MNMIRRQSGPLAALIFIGLLYGTCAIAAAAQEPGAPASAAVLPADPPQTLSLELNWQQDVKDAMVRLPLAALLGVALAFRPKRKGTPTRTPAVAQTQIILTVVGAVIMLVVGASLARAFGIVGAANLVRYRSKIDNPKDAGVMLCCLAVGLASGVGLFALAIVSTIFLVAVLFVIESFEPDTANLYELKLKMGADSSAVRPPLESLLARLAIEHALRSSSKDELSYDVKVPFGTETDQITDEIQKLSPGDELSVAWTHQKAKAVA